jgi:hypothetical protein
MTSKDFAATLAMYAQADQRATAGLIEMLTAAVLLKLNPPARGDDVVEVSIHPQDIADMVASHHFEAVYSGETMTIYLTPLNHAKAES